MPAKTWRITTKLESQLDGYVDTSMDPIEAISQAKRIARRYSIWLANFGACAICWLRLALVLGRLNRKAPSYGFLTWEMIDVWTHSTECSMSWRSLNPLENLGQP